MKFHHLFISAIITTFLVACNFTLAADVTSPPGYIAPSPQPTLGPLYPANAPDVSNGKIIYVEKCAACHGDTGLGDGEQGKQLPFTVAAFALPETARKASPADWFTTVTQGNIERFMPPFDSLNEQQKWDVVSYALTLHTTPEHIELGRSLFESNCADCAEKFRDQKMMSALSANDLVRLIKNGEGDIPAFGNNFTDDEAFAVAAYLRTLTFAAILPTPTPFDQTQGELAPATETPVSTEAGTPSAEITPVDGTQAAVTPEAVVAGVGNVRGTVDNQTGADLPSELKVILSGFEHDGSDPSASPQEILTIEGIVNADRAFVFENVEIPENRIYIAKVEVNGLAYQSGFVVVEAGAAELALPPIIVYATTEDYSELRVDALQMYFDFANEEIVQMLAVYSIMNATEKTVIIKFNGAQEIPFIKIPNGAESVGYEESSNSAGLIALDDGFAIPPSEMPYELIAIISIPKGKEITIDQPVLLPVAEAMLLVPEGVTAKGVNLTSKGVQSFNGNNFNMYTSNGIDAGGNISFTLTGGPQTTTVNPDMTQNKTLLIGVGAFGLALILAGAWMFMRDRKRVENSDEDEDEFDDPESIMDAIIAIDDLHRAGKLSDEAYQTRRSELKNALKRKA